MAAGGQTAQTLLLLFVDNALLRDMAARNKHIQCQCLQRVVITELDLAWGDISDHGIISAKLVTFVLARLSNRSQ